MADNFAGMFRDPRSYRDERLQDLMQQRAGISQMGGSMSQLLGQVAAGGGATGAQMAEGLGGMFGLQTREEAQAQKVQDMAKMIDMNEPEDLNQFAMALNDMGMTKEAVMVLEKRQSVLDRIQRETDAATERQRSESEWGDRTRDVYEEREIMVPVWDTKKENIVGYRPSIENVRVTEYYNPKTKKWERKSGSAGSSTKGGLAGPAVRMPAGEKVTVTDPATGKPTEIDRNVMINSPNKPMSSLADSLRLWWEGL